MGRDLLGQQLAILGMAAMLLAFTLIVEKEH